MMNKNTKYDKKGDDITSKLNIVKTIPMIQTAAMKTRRGTWFEYLAEFVVVVMP